MHYQIEITLEVRSDSDEHLRNEQAIRDEVTSWLESLHATVHRVTVRDVAEGETQ